MTVGKRMVHARLGSAEIVHYRPGKWFSEGRGGQPRAQLTVNTAAHRAFNMELRGGEIFIGLPGGRVFDWNVNALRTQRRVSQ